MVKASDKARKAGGMVTATPNLRLDESFAASRRNRTNSELSDFYKRYDSDMADNTKFFSGEGSRLDRLQAPGYKYSSQQYKDEAAKLLSGLERDRGFMSAEEYLAHAQILNGIINQDTAEYDKQINDLWGTKLSMGGNDAYKKALEQYAKEEKLKKKYTIEDGTGAIDILAKAEEARSKAAGSAAGEKPWLREYSEDAERLTAIARQRLTYEDTEKLAASPYADTFNFVDDNGQKQNIYDLRQEKYLEPKIQALSDMEVSLGNVDGGYNAKDLYDYLFTMQRGGLINSVETSETYGDTEKELKADEQLIRDLWGYYHAKHPKRFGVGNAEEQQADSEREERLNYLSGKYGDTVAKEIKGGTVQSLTSAINSMHDSIMQSAGDTGISLGDYNAYMNRKADYIEEQNRQEQYKKIGELLPLIPMVMTVPTSLLSGLEYLGDAAASIGHSDKSDVKTYRPINTYDNIFTNATQGINSATAESIQKWWGDRGQESIGKFLSTTYGGVSSALDSTAVVLGSTALFGPGAAPAISSVILGSSAASSETADAVQRGATTDKALLYGFLAGVNESVGEALSLDIFVGNFLKGSISIDTFKESLASIGKVLGQGVVEGSEEVFTDLLNRIADNAINVNRSSYNTSIREYMESGMTQSEAERAAAKDFCIQLLESAYGGFIGGAMMGGGATVAATVNSITNNRNDNLQLGADALRRFDSPAALSEHIKNELGLSEENYQKLFNAADKVSKIKDKDGKYSSRSYRKAGKLTAEAEAAIIADMPNTARSEIQQELTLRGMDKSDSEKYAGYINDKFFGKEIGADAKKAISENETAAELSKELGTFDEENESDFKAYLKDSVIRKAAEKINEFKNYGRSDENGFHVSDDDGYDAPADDTGISQTVKNSELRISGEIGEVVGENENGEVTVKLDGKTVPLDRVNFQSNAEAVLYSFAKDMSVDSANDMISQARKVDMTAERASAFASAWKLAYDMGYAKRSIDTTLRALQGYSLSKEQIKLAHARGAIADAKYQENEIRKMKEQTRGRGRGKVTYESGAKSKVTKEQQLIADVLAEVGYNIKFENSADGANGSFSWGSDTITVNLGEGATELFGETLSHELVHSMKKESPELYGELTAYVAVEMGEDKFEAYVLNRQRAENMSYEDAVDETVARSLSEMLENSQALTRFAEKHMSIFEKIAKTVKDFITRISDAIKSLYGERSTLMPIEARELMNRAENLQEMFDRALENTLDSVHDRVYDKGENNQKSTAEERVQNSAKSEKKNFIEDKYFERQIRKWEELNPIGYVRVGEIAVDSPLNLVGMPATSLYFDISKITKAMGDHGDHLNTDIMAQIPKLLNDPIVITEYRPGENTNTVNVYGNLVINESPIAVGIVATMNVGGKNYINKVRTIHARRDFMRNINDKTVLYLNENKKKTKQWFQTWGQHVPTRVTKFGLIRSIQLNGENVNSKAQNSSKEISTEFDKVQYSLKGVNKDGIEVYETSKRIRNLPRKQRIKMYLDAIKKDFRGRTARFEKNGEVYYAEFEIRSARKPIYGEKNSSNNGVNSLINVGAEGDIFDLVENSKYNNSAPDTKGHKVTDKYTDYFDYFYKSVQIDGVVYDLNLDIKKSKKSYGGYIYTLKLNENNKIEASPAKTPISNDKVFQSQQNASADSISKIGKNVNSKTQNSSKEISTEFDKVQYSLKEREYAEYDKPITVEDVQTLRSIERKSVNSFNSEEIQKTQKWAHKFYKELGTKSPFFRAWFGDWRAQDQNTIDVISIKAKEGKNPRGTFTNKDTGWNIVSSSVGYDETISHSGKSKYSIITMQNIDSIIEKSVLLDTEVSEYGRGKKSVYTAFMHKFYAPIVIEGKPYIAKLSVDESHNPGHADTNKKFYHVRSIKIESAPSVGIGLNHTPIMETAVSNISISDLHAFVKQHDEKFKPKPVNRNLLNKDGTPKKFYHGTKDNFTEFKLQDNPKFGRALGDGFYFTDDYDRTFKYANGIFSKGQDRGGVIMPVYLKMENPYVITEDNYKKVIPSDHDGIIDKRDGTYMVYNSNQIKSATDNIGTFDETNPDIRYSRREVEGVTAQDRLIEALRETIETKEDMRILDEWQDGEQMLGEFMRQEKILREQIKEARSELPDNFKWATSEAKKLKPELRDKIERLEQLQDAQREMSSQIRQAERRLTQLSGTGIFNDLMRRVSRDTREQVTKRYSKQAGQRILSEEMKRIQKIHDKLTKMLLNPRPGAFVPKSLAGGVAKVLKIFDTNRMHAEQLETYNQKISHFKSRRDSAKKAGRTKSVEYYENQIAEFEKKKSRIAERNTGLSAVLAELRNEFDRFINDDDEHSFGRTVSQELLKAADFDGIDKPVDEMTYKELVRVTNALTALETYISNESKYTVKGKEYSAANDARVAIAETNNSMFFKGFVGKTAFKLNIKMLSPERAFSTFGGYAKGSVWDRLYARLDEGQLEQKRLKMEMLELFDPLVQNKDVSKLSSIEDAVEISFEGVGVNGNTKYGLFNKNGEPVKMTRAMMLSVLMHTYNTQNWRHLWRGGMDVPDMKMYYKNDGKSAYAKGDRIAGHMSAYSGIYQEMDILRSEAESDSLTPMQRREKYRELKAKREELMSLFSAENDARLKIQAHIEGILTEYEKEWIKEAKNFFDNVSKKHLNKTSVDMYGFEKAVVNNYFPIVTDPKFRDAAFDDVSRDVSLENMGNMKSRTGASNPLMLEDITKVIDRQINNVSKYCGLMPAIADFKRVYNKRFVGSEESVMNALETKFGVSATKYISNLIADLQGARNSESGLLDMIRGNTAAAVLTLNVPVTFAQTASYPTAASVVGWKALRKALSKVFTRVDFDLIKNWSPLMWVRNNEGSDITVADMNKVRSSSYRRKQINNKLKWLTGWITMADTKTVGTLWYAAEYYVQDNFTTSDYKKGTDKYYMKVAEVFNEIVEKTQPNYTTMQRPDILRSPNAFVKQMSMFMTQRLQNFNILYDAGAKYLSYRYQLANNMNNVTSEDVRVVRRDLGRAVASQLVAGLTITTFKFVSALILGRMSGYKDDDGELTSESIIMHLIDTFLDTMAGNIMFGSTLYEMLISKNFFGGSFYGFSMTGLETFNELWDGGDALLDMLTGKKKFSLSTIKELAHTFAKAFGIPSANAEKLFLDIWNHAKNIYNETPYKSKDRFEDMIAAIASGHGLTDGSDLQLYRSIIRGDVKRVEKIRNTIKGNDAEKEWEDKIKSSLKKYDDRIEDAVNLRLSGDTRGYADIFDDITGDGFDAEIVSDVISSEQTSLLNLAKNAAIAKAESNDKDYADYLKKMTDREYGKKFCEGLISDQDAAAEAAIDKEAEDAALEGIFCIYDKNDIYLNLEKGDFDYAGEITDTIFEYKRQYFEAKGYSEKDVISKSKNSVKQMFGALYKNRYKYGDDAERERIKNMLLKVEADGKKLYKQSDFDSWGE